MPRFLLLPRDPVGGWDDVSPAEMQRIVEKYVAWSAKLGEAGRLKGGEKLAFEGGKVLRRNGESVAVTDGPFVEAKEVVGGFWIIEATDYDDALEVVTDCPHLEYGSLEVRRIE